MHRTIYVSCMGVKLGLVPCDDMHYTGALLYLTTVACHFPQLTSVARVGGRVSGYVNTINELIGSGN